jgi:hypothetical protein
MERMARTEPSLDFNVVDSTIVVTSTNVKSVVLNLWHVDLEVLFSISPFGVSGRASEAVGESGTPLTSHFFFRAVAWVSLAR